MNFADMSTKIAKIKYQLIAYAIVIAIIGCLGYGCKYFYAQTVVLENTLKLANERIKHLEEENAKIKGSSEITEKSILAILQGEKKIDTASSNIEVAVQKKIDDIRSKYSGTKRSKKTITVNANTEVASNVPVAGQSTVSEETAKIVAEVAVVTEYENKISEVRIDGLWAVYCRHVPKGTDSGCDKQFDEPPVDKPNQIDPTIQKATNHEETVR